MSFKDFIRSVRVTTTTRGAFVADIKTLINADVFPPVEVWADLYRFLSRRGSSSETIDIQKLAIAEDAVFARIGEEKHLGAPVHVGACPGNRAEMLCKSGLVIDVDIETG